MTDPYKEYRDPPHLVAGRLVRLVEGLADVRFGAESRKQIGAFIDGIYRMWWEQHDKDMQEIAELKAMKQRILDRVAYIQRHKGRPENQGLESSYAGEMTLATLALGYHPKEQSHD